MRQPARRFRANAARQRLCRRDLAETRDALEILASPAAARPALLRPALSALFCATRSDWERFDEIFEAYWLGRGMKRMRVASMSGASAGTIAECRPFPSLAERMAGAPQSAERQTDEDGDGTADSHERPARASSAEALSRNDLRDIVDPAGDRADPRARRAARPSPCGRGWCGASRRGGAGGGSTSGAPSIAASPMAARPSIWSGAGARRSRCGWSCCSTRSGSMSLYTAVLRALPAWRGRRLPRVRGLRVPHAARACLGLLARPRRGARGRPAVADGAGHRRRHAHRRMPGDLQPLACQARDQFAHGRDDRLRRLRHRRARAAGRRRCDGCAAAAAASSGSTR